MPPVGNIQPVAEPLGVAAMELFDLARLADRLEILVAELASRGVSADPVLMMECQIADMLSQRLIGLGAFLAALATAVPADARVDVGVAVRGLALSDQARCLAALSPQDPATDGELTLFGD